MLENIKTRLFQTRDPELVEDEEVETTVVEDVELPEYDPSQFILSEEVIDDGS